MSEYAQSQISPADVIANLRDFHESNDVRPSTEIDQLVYGTTCTEYDKEVFRELLAVDTDDPVDEPLGRMAKKHKLFGRETTWGPGSESIWTPYEVARDVVKTFELNSDDVFIDLGSGYGRMPIYAGINSDAECVGVELVAQRTEFTERRIALLGLANVRTRTGNVREIDYSDGTAFYMYAPFNQETTGIVIDELVKMSEEKHIKVAMRATRYLLDSKSSFELYDEHVVSHRANSVHGSANIYYFQSK